MPSFSQMQNIYEEGKRRMAAANKAPWQQELESAHAQGPQLGGTPPPAAANRPPGSAPPIADGHAASRFRSGVAPTNTGSLPFDVRDRRAQMAQDVHRLGLQSLERGRALPMAEAAQGQGAAIDRGMVNRDLAAEGQTRGFQLGNLDRLTAAAEGTAPSAAEIQQQRGLGQALAGQMAAANSARGGAGAMMAARRQAATQGVNMQNQAIQDAGALRAQEQAAARGLLTGAISDQRAGDMGRAGLNAGLATNQAGFDQQTAMTNLGNQQAVNMLNPQMVLQSRRMDDARGQALLGLGGQSDQMAGQIGLQGLGLEQDYLNSLLDREGMRLTSSADASRRRRQTTADAFGAVSGGLGFLAGL